MTAAKSDTLQTAAGELTNVLSDEEDRPLTGGDRSNAESVTSTRQPARRGLVHVCAGASAAVVHHPAHWRSLLSLASHSTHIRSTTRPSTMGVEYAPLTPASLGQTDRRAPRR
jgi:hypothetical protein